MPIKIEVADIGEEVWFLHPSTHKAVREVVKEIEVSRRHANRGPTRIALVVHLEDGTEHRVDSTAAFPTEEQTRIRRGSYRADGHRYWSPGVWLDPHTYDSTLARLRAQRAARVPANRIRRGTPHPSGDGRLFWSYTSTGAEYWVDSTTYLRYRGKKKQNP